jgi:selenocysteine-specific elongation factor
MKHLILGTSGHVDHGKTLLVKALTGIDCDTHKEEKLRGITINLGFAHLDLPSGDTIGIIDVPGHRDFINTMVAGACGIDMALLVVAADGGVMPQTREHLQIMMILGIRTGIVAITRIDLTGPAETEATAAKISELTKGTFLENCPVVKVSSKTGEGIETLKKTIGNVALTLADRPRRELFRMYIDRIFSVSGFGTVVTGSVIGGSIREGAKAYLLPAGKELRVRRLEHHGREVKEVIAGDRASLNLAGLSREEFVRGMMVADRLLRTTQLLDARLYLFDPGRTLGLWSQAAFLMGTYETQAKVHLIDRNVLEPGGNGIVQIHLPAPCVAQTGDRFVLRSSSSDISLGGGEIIDPTPLHHRRRPPELVENLSRLASGKLPELLATEIRKHPSGITHNDLATILNISPEEVLETARQSMPEGILTFNNGTDLYFLSREMYDALIGRCFTALSEHHRRNPLAPEGKTAEELLGLSGMEQSPRSTGLLRTLLEGLVKEGKLKKAGHTWVLADHTVEITPRYQEQIGSIEKYLIDSGMKTPIPVELAAYAQERGIDEKTLRQILRHLVNTKKAYAIEGSYLYGALVDSCRVKLLRKLAETPEGITVAQFRDLIGANRKICLLLLAIFDGEEVTERQGDVRVITGKGREAVGGE